MRQTPLVPFNVSQLHPTHPLHHLLHLTIELPLQFYHILLNAWLRVDLRREILQLLMQFEQTLDYFVLVGVGLYFLDSGSGSISLPTSKVLEMINLYFSLNLFLQLTGQSHLDGVELLLTCCLYPCSFGLRAHTYVIGIVGFVMVKFDECQDLCFLFGLTIFRFVLLFRLLSLKQAFLKTKHLKPQFFILSLKLLNHGLQSAMLDSFQFTLTSICTHNHYQQKYYYSPSNSNKLRLTFLRLFLF